MKTTYEWLKIPQLSLSMKKSSANVFSFIFSTYIFRLSFLICVFHIFQLVTIIVAERHIYLNVFKFYLYFPLVIG